MNKSSACWLGIISAIVMAGAVSGWAADPPQINLRDTVVVEVVKQIKGAVVNISTQKLVSIGGGRRGGRGGGGGAAGGPKVLGTSLGSGFIIHPDGYVVTNNHVIDQAREITVGLDDGRTLPAEVINADPDHDLAILKINDRKPFPFLTLADSEDLMIGEPAIAVGNPFGFSHTVSTGIISANHRDLNDPSDPSLQDLIQTDAAINPGNSGGPLLNAYGQVVGINTAILRAPNPGMASAEGQPQSIGFAIPINRLRDLIPSLLDPAKVNHIDFPVVFKEQREDVPPDKVNSLIVNVDHPTQILTSINGQKPLNIIDAYDLLLAAKVGVPVTLVYQDAVSKNVVTKRITPTETALAAPVQTAKDMLGLIVQQMTPRLAEEHNLQQQEDGVLVDSVIANGAAQRAGIHKDDVLIAILLGTNRSRFPITGLDDLMKRLQTLRPDATFYLQVLREDGSHNIQVSLAAPKPATIPAAVEGDQ